MGKIRIYGTQNWRKDLSQPRELPQLPDLNKTNAINARLAQFPLENEAKQAQLARAQSAEARSRYQLQKEIETDRQKAAFYNGLQELESNLSAQGYGIGTKQHAEAFAAYAHAFPLARSSADVDKTLQLHAKVNDDQAALTHRIQTQLGAFKEAGVTPEGGSVTQSGDVDMRFRQGGQPSTKAQERYAKLQGMITSHLEGSASEAASNKAALKANVPYSQAPAFHAAQTEAAILEQQFPGLKQQPATDIVQPTPTPAPDVTPAPQAPNTTIPVTAPTPTATPNHSAALDWANANPNDPRAAAIIERARAAMPNQDEGQ